MLPNSFILLSDATSFPSPYLSLSYSPIRSTSLHVFRSNILRTYHPSVAFLPSLWLNRHHLLPHFLLPSFPTGPTSRRSVLTSSHRLQQFFHAWLWRYSHSHRCALIHHFTPLRRRLPTCVYQRHAPHISPIQSCRLFDHFFYASGVFKRRSVHYTAWALELLSGWFRVSICHWDAFRGWFSFLHRR